MDLIDLARSTASLLTRLGRHVFGSLAWLAVLCAGAWGFVEIADEVVEGETRAIDRALLLALRDPVHLDDPIGPPWVEELGRDFSALGSMGVLLLVVLGVVGYLLLQRRARIALFTSLAVASGFVSSLLLRLGFDRPRPELVSHETIVQTASFPSGHSMQSALTYLTLAALLGRVQTEQRLRAYGLLLAVVVSGLVGVSRVYLGVHWPSDVLAGWAAGAAWAALCWLIAQRLQRRWSEAGARGARRGASR